MNFRKVLLALVPLTVECVEIASNVAMCLKAYRRLGVETERSGVPYRESKPSAHRHRTARTTRQINGANSLEARAI